VSRMKVLSYLQNFQRQALQCACSNMNIRTLAYTLAIIHTKAVFLHRNLNINFCFEQWSSKLINPCLKFVFKLCTSHQSYMTGVSKICRSTIKLGTTFHRPAIVNAMTTFTFYNMSEIFWKTEVEFITITCALITSKFLFFYEWVHLLLNI
jgi:hypothetical protein